MKLKLIDISRAARPAEQETNYTLISTFSGKTLVDLSIYRELLTGQKNSCRASVSAQLPAPRRLTNRQI